MIKDAVIDPTGIYRYSLTRVWDKDKPRACFCMLNPSTADSNIDDPTIRRCISFAERFGCGSLEVVNLFAFRATRPADLFSAPFPVGEENNAYIKQAVARSQMVVAAWGAQGGFLNRDTAVLELLNCEARALGFTYGGHPRHPLYLRKDAELVEFYRPQRKYPHSGLGVAAIAGIEV